MHFLGLSSRQREAEWMDAPDADPVVLRRSLAFIERVNRLLGYTQATLGHLERFSRNWKEDERVRILDVATGSADVPRAILRWVDRVNRRRGWKWDVRIVAMDLHAGTLAAAGAPDAMSMPTRRLSLRDSTVESLENREGTRGDRAGRVHGATLEMPPRLHLVRGDALSLPFPDGGFDYAITSMFLHHLSDEAAERVLSGMSRVARRGIIAADLLRHRRAYAWISLFTLLSNPMVRHDARVSVRQAFTRPEVLRLRDRAGLGFARYYRHFGHRFALAGEKDSEGSRLDGISTPHQFVSSRRNGDPRAAPPAARSARRRS